MGKLMKICISCGKEHDQDSEVCIECGLNSGTESSAQDLTNDTQKSDDNSYIFKKLDDDLDQASISFRKLDDNEILAPVDRITPIKKELKEFYIKGMTHLNKIFGKIRESIANMSILDKCKGIKERIHNNFIKAKLWIIDRANHLKQMSSTKQKLLKTVAITGVLLVLLLSVGVSFYSKSDYRLFNMAESFEKKNDYENAIEIYTRILEKNPDNLIAKERIAFIYLDHLQQPKLAEKYLKEIAMISDDPEMQLKMNNIFPVILASPEANDTVYKELITIELFTTAKDATIKYAIKNSDGESEFFNYSKPIELKDGKNVVLAQGISSYGLVSEIYTFSFTIDLENKFVELENKSLETAIKNALGKSQNEQLRESDIKSIYAMQIIGDTIAIDKDIISGIELNKLINADSVKANGGGLKDLTKLQSLKTLSLYLQEDSEELEDIASIPTLEELTIRHSNISNIQFLNNFKGLSYLELSDNKIENLNGIQGLSNLKYLNLSRNKIIDAYHISNQTGLTHLYLTENAVQDLGVLKKLGDLEELSFTSDSRTDFEFLSGMKKLKKLDVLNPSNYRASSYSDGVDISSIAGLKELEYLSLPRCGVKNVTALSALGNLRDLNLNYNAIDSEGLEVIGKLTKLQRLNLKYNQIDTNLESIKNLSNIKYLNLSYNVGIDDFSGLENLQNLETLILQGVRLSDFDNISRLNKLVHLDLASNKLEAITFKEMAKLEFLNLESNNIITMPDISNLSSIKAITLKNNPISDITALESANNNSLQLLDLSNTRITDASSFGRMTGLKVLNISGNNAMLNMSVFDNLMHINIIPINSTEEDIPSNFKSND